jgi:hypothetical protein
MFDESLIFSTNITTSYCMGSCLGNLSFTIDRPIIWKTVKNIFGHENFLPLLIENKK